MKRFLNRRNFYFALGLLLGVALYVVTSLPIEIKADFWPDSMHQFKIKDSHLITEFMVSITPLDETGYLIANYGQIALFNSADYTISEMKLAREGGKELLYNPTGLFFSRRSRLLYVANYTGNNVLVCSVDAAKFLLTLTAEIKSSHTIGPENVFVSDDEKFLLCANYTGGSVTAFDISVSPPAELWNTTVGEWGHGVCIVNDKVYATGLGERKLFELDLKSGRVLRASGRLGWDPARTSFMWPTSVNPYSSSELLVSDAHNGIIYLIDRSTLKAKKYLGGNGPTFKYLNMPYCAIVHNEKIIILSTYQRRILLGDRKSFKIYDVVSNDRNAWKHLKTKRRSLKRLGVGWNEYIWRGGPAVQLFGKEYFLGFNHLYPREKGRKDYNLIMPHETGSLFNSEGQLYFLNVKSLDCGLILFTPERGQAYFLFQGATTYLFPILLEMDSWSIEDEIYGPSGKVDLSKIRSEVEERVTLMEYRREPGGILKRKDMHEIMFPEYTDKDFERKFREIFRSPQGLRFYETYIRCSSSPCSKEKVRSIAGDYYGGIREESYVNLDELMMVHMATGVTP